MLSGGESGAVERARPELQWVITALTRVTLMVFSLSRTVLPPTM